MFLLLRRSKEERSCFRQYFASLHKIPVSPATQSQKRVIPASSMRGRGKSEFRARVYAVAACYESRHFRIELDFICMHLATGVVCSASGIDFVSMPIHAAPTPEGGKVA